MGGAESNVAIGLVRLGRTAGWLSRLGEDEAGCFVLNTVRGEGVDTSRVTTDPGAPTGLYLKERSALGDPRVFYYRKGSAASRMTPLDLDEDYIRSARALHVTGITPALSKSSRDTVLAAMEIARSAGLVISFDPNIRYKLWSLDEARPVLMDMARRATIVLPGLSEGQALLGVEGPLDVARGFLKSGASVVATKLGAGGALVASPDEMHHVPSLEVAPVDTIGAGDAFDAAFLASYLEGLALLETCARACVAGALATLVFGDWEGMPSRQQIDSQLAGTMGISR
jgi:2-dehydro-3-deoxygluconokinase